jgi:hypothetical protein
MGMAHMLGLPQTVPKLTSWAPRNPLLHPHQVFYFGVDNIEPFEQQQIAELGLRSIRLPQVVKDPVRAARRVLDTWGRQFECLLVHPGFGRARLCRHTTGGKQSAQLGAHLWATAGCTACIRAGTAVVGTHHL